MRCEVQLGDQARRPATKAISTEPRCPTGEFYLIDYRLRETAQAATSGYLHDFINMGIDLDKSRWDTGTADFAPQPKVYFMCGDVNFVDDDFTYVLIFNKKMREAYAKTVADPYRTVRDWGGRWIISTRSFRAFPPITGTATGMRTIPTALSRRGVRQHLLHRLRPAPHPQRPHHGYACAGSGGQQQRRCRCGIPPRRSITTTTRPSCPPGQENRGLACFKGGRAMFYSEIANYLPTPNKEMDGDYGVLPVPKYDKAQQYLPHLDA